MKKTDIQKILGRKSHTLVYKINVLKQSPFKEQVMIRDFTSKHKRYG